LSQYFAVHLNEELQSFFLQVSNSGDLLVGGTRHALLNHFNSTASVQLSACRSTITHGVLKGNLRLWKGRFLTRTPYIPRTDLWIQASSNNSNDNLKSFFS